MGRIAAVVLGLVYLSGVPDSLPLWGFAAGFVAALVLAFLIL